MKKWKFRINDIPYYIDRGMKIIDRVEGFLRIARMGLESIPIQKEEGERSKIKKTEKKDTPYETLGVFRQNSDDFIKQVWRDKSKKVHPDMPGGSVEAQQRINSAWEKIKKERGIK